MSLVPPLRAFTKIMAERDTQLIELAGRHRLISELLLSGLEVAMPVRDRGIDLIAYADLSAQVERFVARPIQLKAASSTTFAVDQKYRKISGLIIAYVWNLECPEKAATYALSYSEAEGIAEAMGWTSTASWLKGSYSNTRPGEKLIGLLRQHLMTPDKWWEKVTEQKKSADP